MIHAVADLSWPGRAGRGLAQFRRCATNSKSWSACGRNGCVTSHPGVKIVWIGVADMRSKGLAERANGHLETSFLPAGSFAGPADSALGRRRGWHRRVSGTIAGWACRPVGRRQACQAPMLALPPVVRMTGWWRREHIAYTIKRLRGRYALSGSAPGRREAASLGGRVLNVVHS